MKRVINGKVYDTHTATIMGHICVRRGTPHIVWVYRKPDGEYFRVINYYRRQELQLEAVDSGRKEGLS